MNTKKLGEQGECLAAEYLNKRGCRILARNFRLKFGEIDLIVRDKDCICFVEVKTRRFYDAPQDAVSPSKQRKLTRIAQAYLKQHYQTVDVRCRFDVIAIDHGEDGKYKIELFQNAFEA